MNAPLQDVVGSIAVRRVLVQLSDVHYVGDGRLFGGLSLRNIFTQVRAILELPQYTPEAIVVTGDLVHRGTQASYRDLQREFELLRVAFAVPIVVTFGNHDDMERAGAVFPTTQIAYTETHRIVSFDNSDPEITPQQERWLSDQLAQPYRSGTILAFHHSPLPSLVPILQRRGMENRGALARVVENSDVIQILTGHYHHAMAGTFAGVPCWSSPALSTQQIMAPQLAEVDHGGGSGFSVVELSEFGPITTPIWLDIEQSESDSRSAKTIAST
ncbi:MAG TPA: metallophosphoesterase [Candidatus Agrococcus pullicola]|uniref:Metallophosphoesterase n=1 Tax=Candidatus Agrococcus pullicola TaxID=2838429 RepID=A0A9D1YXI6_9MICO|nr:metallophosphoesterase [Candidatus Agrococcus pullicola]